MTPEITAMCLHFKNISGALFHMIQNQYMVYTKERNCVSYFQLGFVAEPVIQATGRLESEDGLRTGVLLHMGSR